MSERALYQPALRGPILFASLLLASLLLAACRPASPAMMDITLLADGQTHSLQLPVGSTAAQALQAAGLTLGPLDRSQPYSLAQLEPGDSLRLIRVEENYEVVEQAIPFVSRTLHNEALGIGEQRLVQNGANGLEETTYRLVYEDGELVSRTAVRSQVLQAPVEEIVMLGAQSPFSSLNIPGRLAFLAGGNAWLLEANTAARQPLVTSGDLDGRVFDISPDGDWLLFTRAGESEGQINHLWVISLNDMRQIDLGVGNIVHYAGWVPGAAGMQVAFSSVEPSLNPPGWSANNDLHTLSFTAGGGVSAPRQLLPPRRTDSLYSWWGSGFAWSPGGETLALTRPDALGGVNLESGTLEVWLPFIPYQTNSDWAWMPSIAWGGDGWLYTVDHAEQSGLEQQGRSPVFDLVALSPQAELRHLAHNVGMFANPAPQPGGGQVAYLRAFTPSQSDISGYELMVLATGEGGAAGASLALFPPSGAAGLQPQRLAWSPNAEAGGMLAFVYQGNLWVVNVLTGEARQLTGDGLVAGVDWQ